MISARNILLRNTKRSAVRLFSTEQAPWTQPMDDQKFDFMRRVLAAPSPIGMEAAMTLGVLKPEFESFMDPSWKVHQFKGSASVVLDSAPGRYDLPSIMFVGHCDKIRMQVRHISNDGKVYIDCPSFLPLTLIGNEVDVYSEDMNTPGQYRVIRGGTVEALGAIHFASPKLRSGDAGVKPEQIYLELGVHGEKRKEQVTEELGIRPGDTILMNRPIKRGVAKDTFTGAYLDNGLGCFVATELGRLVASSNIENVRCLFAIAAFEEIGRFGSRILASEFEPDMLVAVDVNHDYVHAPGVGDKRFPELEMGKGFTISVGSVVSPPLNTLIQNAAKENGIPYQMDQVTHDTGTDAMAGVLGAVDCATASLGFPIRNMHTVSECGHTGDVLSCIHGLHHLVKDLDAKESVKTGSVVDFLTNNQPDLTHAVDVSDTLYKVKPEPES